MSENTPNLIPPKNNIADYSNITMFGNDILEKLKDFKVIIVDWVFDQDKSKRGQKRFDKPVDLLTAFYFLDQIRDSAKTCAIVFENRSIIWFSHSWYSNGDGSFNYSRYAMNDDEFIQETEREKTKRNIASNSNDSSLINPIIEKNHWVNGFMDNYAIRIRPNYEVSIPSNIWEIIKDKKAIVADWVTRPPDDKIRDQIIFNSPVDIFSAFDWLDLKRDIYYYCSVVFEDRSIIWMPAWGFARYSPNDAEFAGIVSNVNPKGILDNYAIHHNLRYDYIIPKDVWDTVKDKKVIKISFAGGPGWAAGGQHTYNPSADIFTAFQELEKQRHWYRRCNISFEDMTKLWLEQSSFYKYERIPVLRKFIIENIEKWDPEIEKAAEEYKAEFGIYPDKLLTSEAMNTYIQFFLLKAHGEDPDDKTVVEKNGCFAGSLGFLQFELDCYTNEAVNYGVFFLTSGTMPDFFIDPDDDGEPLPVVLQKAA